MLGRRRAWNVPRVTICIPAYQSADFIDRALRFAMGQDLSNIRILVSVDLSTDGTEEICRAMAKTDKRVEVLTTTKRLGWGGNCAKLIEHVETEFFCLYFHDDIMLPQFCSSLVAALDAAPEAQSANCTTALMRRDHILIPAHAYDGQVADRLCAFLSADRVPGAPMRSMVRRAAIPRTGVFETGPAGGLEQTYAYIAALLMAGPAAAVSETLHARWIRDDGFVEGWAKTGFAKHFASWQRVLGRLVPMIQAAVPEPRAQAAVLAALAARAYLRLTQLGDAPLDPEALAPARLHPDLPDLSPSLPGVEDLVKRAQKRAAKRAKSIRAVGE